MKLNKKPCKTCGNESFIFSKGECLSCSKLRYSKKKKVKPAEPSIWDLIKQKDRLYSRYRRIQASNKFGKLSCYICGKSVRWEEAHLMHFIDRGKSIVRFEELNTHPGCYTCNVVLEGNLKEYRLRLVEDYGESAVRELESRSGDYNFHDKAELIKDIEELKRKIKGIKNG